MILKSKHIVILIAAVTLVSCDKSRVFDDFHSVGSAWHRDSIVSYNLPKLDTTKSYDLFVNLRTSNKYPFSNLFLIVALEQPDGMTKVDTLEYQMAEPDGTMLGNGFSDIKESKLYYKEKMKFKSGKYRVQIKQAVRETGKVDGLQELPGITEVGFRIESLE
ncbi:gliding motility lipoprotein GldH [Flavobacterium ardleyense]|uniref:gliding motility lipoprotein GldH n=1 Tax=Flavobacterium ardleyense TaxID=2038737 RepID=UPI00298CC4D0|nr:gliding motility lipoprotein GldH [Flavobacterium ardleyense]